MSAEEVIPTQPGITVVGADAAAFLVFSESSRNRSGTGGNLEIRQSYSDGDTSAAAYQLSEDGFACFDHLEYGRFPIWAPEPSPCRIFAEIRIPKHGNWNFYAALNNAPASEQMIQEKNPGEWFWFALQGDFYLKAGYNQLDLSMVLGGKQIRRIVFLTENENLLPPPDLRIRRRICQSAVFRSEILESGNGFQVFALEIPCPERSMDDVRVFVVDDHRKLLLPIVKKKHSLYCGLHDRFSGPEKISFEIEFHREAGVNPEFEIPQLLCHETGSRGVSFTSGDSVVYWNPERLNFCGGGICGKTELLLPWNSLPFFEMETSEGNFTSGNAQFHEIRMASDGFQLEFQWKDLPGVLLTAKFTTEGDGLYSLQIIVKNSSAKIFLDSIRTLQFPNVGSEWKNSELLFPKYEPELIRNPASSGNLQEIYPRGAFCFCDFSNGETGLFLGAPDAELYLTRFRCTPSPVRDSVTLSLEKLHRIHPGEEAVFTFHFALHRGDWHEGAKLYRRIFDEIFPPVVHYPDWAIESNGYYAASLASVEADLPEIQPPPYENVAQNHLDRAWSLGMDHIQMWGQAAMDHNCPTFYLPDPQRGGESSFLKMIDLFERYRMRVGSYFHSSAYAPFYAQAEWIRGVPRRQILEDGVLLDRQQFLQALDYRSSTAEAPPLIPDNVMESIGRHEAVIPRQYPRICSFSLEFQNYIRCWIRRYMERYHHTVIYHDQLGNAPQRPEYNPYLGIEGAGNGGGAMLRFLISLYKEFSGRHPDFLQIQEAVTDAFGYYAMPMTSGFQRNIEVYRYTFPEHQIYFGQGNGCWKDRMVYPVLQRSFLEGLKFDVLRIRKDTARLIRFRDSLKHFFFRARYVHRHGVTLDASSGEFRVFYRNSPDEHYLMVTLCNLSEGGTLALTPHVYGTRWKQVTFLDENATVNFYSPDKKIQIPPTRSGVLFFAEKLLPKQNFFCNLEPDENDGKLLRLQIAPLLPDDGEIEFQITHELGSYPAEKVSLANGIFRKSFHFQSGENLHLELSVGSEFNLRRLAGSIHGTYYGYPLNRKNLKMHFYEVPEQERKRILNTEY